MLEWVAGQMMQKGGYVSFFVTARKRSELALATLVQEAFVSGFSTRLLPFFPRCSIEKPYA